MKDCDFIPQDYHATRLMKAAIRLRAGCVSALVAIMAVWVVAHHSHVSSAKAMLPEIARQQEQAEIHLAKKAAMEAEREELKDFCRLLTELEAGVDLVPVLSEISRRMPESVVLVELLAACPSLERFSVEEQPGKSVEPAVSTSKAAVAAPALPMPARDDQNPVAKLLVRGIAVDNADVMRFAAALEGSPLFDRIQPEVKGPTAWAGRRAQSFELTCELVRQEVSKQ